MQPTFRQPSRRERAFPSDVCFRKRLPWLLASASLTVFAITTHASAQSAATAPVVLDTVTLDAGGNVTSTTAGEVDG